MVDEAAASGIHYVPAPWYQSAFSDTMLSIEAGATYADADTHESLLLFAEPAAESPAGFSEEEQASAVDYDPQATYEVGQVIYHRSINRYGKVMEKKVLPGQRYVIHVIFGDDVMILREKL